MTEDCTSALSLDPNQNAPQTRHTAGRVTAPVAAGGGEHPTEQRRKPAHGDQVSAWKRGCGQCQGDDLESSGEGRGCRGGQCGHVEGGEIWERAWAWDSAGGEGAGAAELRAGLGPPWASRTGGLGLQSWVERRGLGVQAVDGRDAEALKGVLS